MSLNNKYFNVTLNGMINTTTAFHSSPPHVKHTKGQPKHLPRMLIGNEGFEVPYISGAGIRGRLRREAFKLVTADLMEKLNLTESPFSMDDYYLNVLGGFARKSDGEVSSLEERERNPIISLFGAAYGWVDSRLSVGFAYPDIRNGEAFQVSTISGVRKDDMETGKIADFMVGENVLQEFLARKEMARKDTGQLKQIDELKKKLRNSKGDEQTEIIREEISEIESSMTGGRTVSAQMPLDGYEVIPAGSDLKHRFHLAKVTASEIGLFLNIIKRFSRHPYLGAKFNHDMGLIEGSYTVSVFSEGAHEKVLSSSLTFGGQDLSFQLGAGFEPYLDAWSDRLSTLSVADMSFLTPKK